MHGRRIRLAAANRTRCFLTDVQSDRTGHGDLVIAGRRDDRQRREERTTTRAEGDFLAGVEDVDRKIGVLEKILQVARCSCALRL